MSTTDDSFEANGEDGGNTGFRSSGGGFVWSPGPEVGADLEATKTGLIAIVAAPGTDGTLPPTILQQQGLGDSKGNLAPGHGVVSLTTIGDGVIGISSSESSQANVSNPSGVLGIHTGGGNGVTGSSSTGDGVAGTGVNGVHGQSSSPSGTGAGVWGENTGASNGIGVFGSSTSGDGVAGTGVNGVHGQSSSDSGTGAGVWGENTGASNGIGVFGSSTSGDGVGGNGVNGVHGISSDPAGIGSGVFGENTGNGSGVAGTSMNGYGGDFSGGLAAIRLEPSSAPPGSPVSGTHFVGELYVDSRSVLYFCVGGGTPGIWKIVQLV